MKAGAPDIEALRELFTELEFTSLLKELLPVVEVGEAHYTEAKSAADVEAVLRAVQLAVHWRWPWKQRSPTADEEQEPEEMPKPESMLPLTAEARRRARRRPLQFLRGPAPRRRFPPRPEARRAASLGAGRRQSAEKHSRLQGGDSCAGAAWHRASRRAARSHALFLLARPDIFFASVGRCGLAPFQSQVDRNPARVGRYHRAACRPRCAKKWKRRGLLKLYEEIDLPLVPVLARMEQAGVKIDRSALVGDVLTPGARSRCQRQRDLRRAGN